MKTERDRLLSEIEAFLHAKGLAASAFGRLAANDTALVMRLRDGSDVTTRTVDRLRQFMRDYRPEKPQRRRCTRSCAA